jgi:hypothetical protein
MVKEQIIGNNGLPLDTNFGAEFIRMLSSAKLIPSQAAKRWNIDQNHINDVMLGNIAPSQQLEEAIKNSAPLNLGDLYSSEVKDKFPVVNDTTDGVVVMHATESDNTMRVLSRTSDTGVKFEVYDYADTAVSRVSESTIIPERIWEKIISDKYFSEKAPRWSFNQGHFEQQMTYFIGKITAYWKDSNEKIHHVNMNTGDMEYHVPFVPHLFTKRDDEEALILAVTFRGELGTRDFLNSIKDMSEEDYMDKVREQLSKINTEQLNTGKVGFFAKHFKDANNFSEGVYKVRKLLNDIPFQQDTLGLEYTVPANSKNIGEHDIKVDVERWGYVFGNSSVKLSWPGHEEILKQNSSFFIKPGIPHSLRSVDEKEGQVLIMQVKPKQENPWNTLALILHYAGEEGVKRARRETKQWTQ